MKEKISSNQSKPITISITGLDSISEAKKVFLEMLKPSNLKEQEIKEYKTEFSEKIEIREKNGAYFVVGPLCGCCQGSWWGFETYNNGICYKAGDGCIA